MIRGIIHFSAQFILNEFPCTSNFKLKQALVLPSSRRLVEGRHLLIVVTGVFNVPAYAKHVNVLFLVTYLPYHSLGDVQTLAPQNFRPLRSRYRFHCPH